MERIERLETELHINKNNIKRLEQAESIEAQRELRLLLMQRSNLKDMLLTAYREYVLRKIV